MSISKNKEKRQTIKTKKKFKKALLGDVQKRKYIPDKEYKRYCTVVARESYKIIDNLAIKFEKNTTRTLRDRLSLFKRSKNSKLRHRERRNTRFFKNKIEIREASVRQRVKEIEAFLASKESYKTRVPEMKRKFNSNYNRRPKKFALRRRLHSENLSSYDAKPKIIEKFKIFIGRRRNGMAQNAVHRKSFVKGILSVASGEETLPASELEEGKRLPHYGHNFLKIFFVLEFK